MTMLNWPLYIENDDATTSPTIAAFTARTGVKVNYKPEIDGNDSFYAKYEPLLAKGKGIDADLVVLTSWMAARMVKNGCVQALDEAIVPEQGQHDPPGCRAPSWDPGRKYTMPWAIGQTGIAYWPDKVGGKITSISDLLDPKFKSRVTPARREDRHRRAVHARHGRSTRRPAQSSRRSRPSSEIEQARDDGQFRKIAGNSYIEDLQLRRDVDRHRLVGRHRQPPEAIRPASSSCCPRRAP